MLFEKIDDPNQFVYHYTSDSIALEHIFPSNQIRFSPFNTTNDPKETKIWGFNLFSPANQLPPSNKAIEIIQETNRLLKNTSKILCLTRDHHNPNDIPFLLAGRGFSHPRMWAQYAANHRGVCLQFEKSKLHKKIIEQLANKDKLLIIRSLIVPYCLLHRDTLWLFILTMMKYSIKV